MKITKHQSQVESRVNGFAAFHSETTAVLTDFTWDSARRIMKTSERFTDEQYLNVNWVLRLTFHESRGRLISTGVNLESKLVTLQSEGTVDPIAPVPLTKKLLGNIDLTGAQRRAMQIFNDLTKEDEQAPAGYDLSKPTRKGDDEYLDIALQYHNLVTTGVRNPNKQLAAHFGREKPQWAADQIRACRARGLLTSGKKGLAVGALTAKSDRMLEERKRRDHD